MAKGRFASTGVGIGRQRPEQWVRRLQNQKGTKVTMGVNVPRQSEGAIGDITVREISAFGLRAYIKTNGGWIDINTMQSADRTQWVDMNLAGSWETDTDFGTPQYFRGADGFVHLRGGCDSGSAYNAKIATLPEGFRPVNTIYRRANTNALLADVALQALRVQSNGEINVVAQRDFDLSSTVSIVWNATAAETEISSDTTIGVSLEGISFFAGQKIRGSGGGSSGSGGGAGSSGGGGGA